MIIVGIIVSITRPIVPVGIFNPTFILIRIRIRNPICPTGCVSCHKACS